MARKPNPARIYEARRAAAETRLTQSKVMGQEEAERWLAAWEAHAATDGIDGQDRDFWQWGYEWISERRHPSRSTEVG